jgi:transposase InsO family protein
MPDNGVIERLFRTFKEQVVHGRVFQTIDEVRDAVRDFVARYNAEWLVEKNGYLVSLAHPRWHRVRLRVRWRAKGRRSLGRSSPWLSLCLRPPFH